MRWPARAWAHGALTALVLVAISVLACAQQLSSTAIAQEPDRDARYFAETGYRIDNDAIWDYFTHRGGLRTFGQPTSRTFQFMGAATQFFQRQIVQVTSSGAPHTLNLLDAGLLPYTKFNGSTLPAADPALASAAPAPGSPGYGQAVVEFVQKNAPDTFDGEPVKFSETFNHTVTLAEAFPEGNGSDSLLPILNLELWGMPTSKPTRDPANNNFIYQRFQRGIMHYDVSCKCTQGLLLADYVKDIITGQNLPDDLAAQAASSPLFKQYDMASHSGPLRRTELAGTNFTNAFKLTNDTSANAAPPMPATGPSTVAVRPPAPGAAPPSDATPAPTAGASPATPTPNTAAAAPTATPESPSPSGGGGSTPPTSPLGDLSTFRTITQDTLDKLNGGDQKGATTRIKDLETAWDKAEATLKPKSPAEWTKIDDKIDEALRQLRAVKPDPANEKTALQDLLDVLK
jgi:hypothetical protein